MPRVKATRMCPQCNTSFPAKPSSDQIYCSRRCIANVRRRSLADRVWARIHRAGPDECWPWTGSLATAGYGSVAKGNHQGGMFRSHRVVWELTCGPIPDGLHVLHRCDNRACCNPAHLFLGTNLDNIYDAVQKGRTPKGEQKATHKLNDEAVRFIRASTRSGLALAKQFGVNPNQIYRVRHRKTWRHVS